MKKLIASLLLAGAAFGAKAAIFINNNTSYTVYITFGAHDVNMPAPCSYLSWRLPVDGGSSVAFNNVTSAGLEWTIPWNIPATPVITGSAFDIINIVPVYNGLSGSIGAPGGCATSTAYSASAGGYTINASWTAIGGGNVLVQINP